MAVNLRGVFLILKHRKQSVCAYFFKRKKRRFLWAGTAGAFYAENLKLRTALSAPRAATMYAEPAQRRTADYARTALESFTELAEHIGIQSKAKQKIRRGARKILRAPRPFKIQSLILQIVVF